MDGTQPNQTLTNIATDLDQLAARTDRLVPTIPAQEADMLSQELCAIRALIDEAAGRLQVLQAKYPEQLEAVG